MPPDTWNLSGTQGNALGNPRSMFGSSQTPYQGILHSTNQSATGATPAQGSTGRPVADLFSITLCDDNVQDFDTRWDKINLSMTKIPLDDILESLYKLRIRKSDQLKAVLELYDIEIRQKISTPDYQKLKTMVKRSTGQKTSITKF